MTLSEMYHVGIVVPDLEGAQARLSSLLAVSWGPTVEIENPLRLPSGESSSVALKMSYSTEAPYLELIEERVGTPWVCNEDSNLHHLGFFSSDVTSTSRNLIGSQCPLEVASSDAMPGTGWAYHRDPLGIRIEIVAQEMRQGLEQFLCVAPPT
jgi:Glyoxalase/Bleomycin resistance protein/Dioxygenase superfamily